MQEAGTTIYPADTEREAYACVTSELRQTREVRIWRPKREAQEACASEASPLKCDIQQPEVYVSSQRHELHVFTTEHGTHGVHVSQVLLVGRNNQQREVRVSSQQRHETRVSKQKRESCVPSTQHELYVFEPCVLDLRCKDSFQKLKIPQKFEASLFDPRRRI